MAVAIRVPDLGTTVDEIKLLDWLVEEGESVSRGQAIAEIETDKAVSELECVADGVLLKQVAQADQTVETGAVLAYVGQAGEPVPEEPTKEPTPNAPAPRVSAVVRNLAAKLCVDLAGLQGTGQGGMITREDVTRAAGKKVSGTFSAKRPAGPAGEKVPDTFSPGGEPLPRAQAAVARAVSTSNQEIPHLRVTADVDMTAANSLRAESAERGEKISYDAIFLKALAAGIESVPLVADRYDGRHVIHPEGTHIAVAVGFDNELFLPVIRDVGRKDLATLSGEIADVASRCKAGTVRAEEMTGGCMTLSNLGMYPIASFDTIIFPEHSSILSVGAVTERPVVRDGEVTVRPTATVALAVDHRLINGRTAAVFLTRVKEALETGPHGA